MKLIHSVLFIFSAVSAQSMTLAAPNYAVPSVLWVAQTSDWGPPSVAIQSNGNVVVGSYTSSYTAVLSDYSTNGIQLWRNTIGFPSQTRADNVQVDGGGNIYVAGSTYASSYAINQGGADVTLQKFNAGGTFQWGRQFGTPQYDWSSGLAVTSNGTSYITSGGWAANYSGSPAGSYTTVHQYLPDGTAGWIANLNTGDGTSPGATAESAQATSLTPTGNVVSAFSNYTSSVSNNINTISFYNYLSSTDAGGKVQWVKPINVGSFATAVDSSGDIYVSGGYIEKFDPLGTLLWAIQNNNLDFQAICLSSDGTLYATEVNSDAIYTFDPQGDELSIVGIPHPAGRIIRLNSLITSGSELVASALIAAGTSPSANEVVLLSVPEPNSFVALWLVVLSIFFKRQRSTQLSRALY